MNEHTYPHLHIRRNMVATISIVSSKLDDGEAIEICQILIGRYFHWSKDYPICSIFSTELKFIGYVFFPCILNMTKAYAEIKSAIILSFKIHCSSRIMFSNTAEVVLVIATA